MEIRNTVLDMLWTQRLNGGQILEHGTPNWQNLTGKTA